MEDKRRVFQNPLITRYGTREMLYDFSDEKRFRLWRRLWISLAEAERELGLDITEEQIAQMKAHQDDINYELAEEKEKELRHDVVAHIAAFGEQCPKAKGIIHLGATSAFVVDNTDLILMRDGLEILKAKLVNVIDRLAAFAEKYKDLVTLGLTHFQPAQPTTVGKRATLWLQDLLMDLGELEHRLSKLAFRGVKGTTGTQASFLALFEGDHAKVERLEASVARKMGFEEVFPVTGQTYPRKLDHLILALLSSIAQSAKKFATDMRLLQHLKEAEEPFEQTQVGSSAMAYKRNPMRSERICALARYVITLAQSPGFTASEQWFERTLDDSANKRLVIPEAFLATDAILDIFLNIVSGIKVYPEVIKKHLEAELPFMATEVILMEAVKAGGDRQNLHGRLREHSLAAAKKIKEEGVENDLLERIREDQAFAAIKDKLPEILKPERFAGRAKEQTEKFLKDEVQPIRKKYKSLLGLKSEMEV